MNTSIFLALNASSTPNAAVLALALFLSEFIPYLLIGFCCLAFILARGKIRIILFAIVLAAAVAAAISWLIGHFAYTPRPFVEGIGNALLPHNDNASFPSNHMMFMSIFAAIFILSGKRKIGLFFTVLAALTGWSRIYLGLHYAVDIIGGALLGVIVSVLLWKALQPCMTRLTMIFNR